MTTAVRDAALAAADAGIAVLPVKEDGTKAPDVRSWTEFQKERPSPELLAKWFLEDRERSGLGFVCGAVSGGLELLDFDERGVLANFVGRCQAAGLGDAVDRVVAGYHEQTPGGDHLLWRCEGVEGNAKFAARPCLGAPECRKHQAGETHVLIETRGNGGFSIAAPSNGRTHESGEAYELLSGSVESIATITEDERRSLLEAARSFDEMPVTRARAATTAATATTASMPDVSRPGDDFNRGADWRGLLEPHGWAYAFTSSGLDYWRRPGKSQGVSATTGPRGGDPDANYLWVFSTATPFESERGYDPFGALAVLDHGGDHRAASRELHAPRGVGCAEARTVLVPVHLPGRPLRRPLRRVGELPD